MFLLKLVLITPDTAQFLSRISSAMSATRSGTSQRLLAVTLAAVATVMIARGTVAAFATVAGTLGGAPRTSLNGLPCETGSSLAASSSIAIPAFFLPAAMAAGVTGAVVQAAAGRARMVCRKASATKEYWAGEWICADCGYIYNERAYGASKFEDQQMGFKCPMCAAPRRRFARKMGDKIGTTLDGGDGPILIFSAVALLVVIAIAYFSLL